MANMHRLGPKVNFGYIDNKPNVFSNGAVEIKTISNITITPNQILPVTITNVVLPEHCEFEFKQVVNNTSSWCFPEHVVRSFQSLYHPVIPIQAKQKTAWIPKDTVLGYLKAYKVVQPVFNPVMPLTTTCFDDYSTFDFDTDLALDEANNYVHTYHLESPQSPQEPPPTEIDPPLISKISEDDETRIQRLQNETVQNAVTLTNTPRKIPLEAVTTEVEKPADVMVQITPSNTTVPEPQIIPRKSARSKRKVTFDDSASIHFSDGKKACKNI